MLALHCLLLITPSFVFTQAGYIRSIFLGKQVWGQVPSVFCVFFFFRREGDGIIYVR